MNYIDFIFFQSASEGGMSEEEEGDQKSSEKERLFTKSAASKSKQARKKSQDLQKLVLQKKDTDNIQNTEKREKENEVDNVAQVSKNIGNKNLGRFSKQPDNENPKEIEKVNIAKTDKTTNKNAEKVSKNSENTKENVATEPFTREQSMNKGVNQKKTGNISSVRTPVLERKKAIPASKVFMTKQVKVKLLFSTNFKGLFNNLEYLCIEKFSLNALYKCTLSIYSFNHKKKFHTLLDVFFQMILISSYLLNI